MINPFRTFALLLGLGMLALPSAPPVLGSPTQSQVSLARGWRHVPIPALRVGVGDPVQLAVGGPGLVVFSFGHPGAPSGLWRSADGRSWQSVRVPAFGPGEQRLGFYAVGHLFVITGSAGNQPRIWASHDGGATWHQSPARLDITALAAGGDGLVAFSQTHTPTTSVWTSADGVRWRQLPQKPGVFGLSEVRSVARSGHRLVAGGETRGEARIWTSSDGRTWTVVPNQNGIFGHTSVGSFVNHVVAGPRGILAIGEWADAGHPSPEQELWVSADGVHWRREPAPFDEPEGNFGKEVGGPLVAWQGGFVTFTVAAQFNGETYFAGGETDVWSSSDGLTWRRLGSDEIFGGSTQIEQAAAFRGGVVAIGSFALHPRAACLKTKDAAVTDLRRFQPAVFRWSPAASVSAPPPAVDRLDPRALKLLPSDFGPAVRSRNVTSTGNGYFSAYVNLCAIDPALGLHRAYSLSFVDPYSTDGHGSLFNGESLSIVTQTPQAASAGFRSVDSLFGLGFGTVQHKRELPPPGRIGEETRVFRLRLLTESDGSDYTYTQFAVAWRQGRVMGVVEAGTKQEAVLLAQRQLAHREHPGSTTDDARTTLRLLYGRHRAERTRSAR